MNRLQPLARKTAMVALCMSPAAIGSYAHRNVLPLWGHFLIWGLLALYYLLAWLFFDEEPTKNTYGKPNI
jgi:uncharacterized membrane protein YhaH (DUF805 family)